MKYCLLILLYSYSLLAYSQIEVSSDRDANGVVTLTAYNNSPMTYTLLLEFPMILNLSTGGGNNVIAVSKPGTSTLTTLKPVQQNQPTNFSYKYRYFKGNVYGKSKDEPIYVVPVQEGTKVRSMPMTHIENRLQPKEQNDDYVGIAFYFEEEVDIVAPRKGVVAGMSMEKVDEGESLDFSRAENYIEIYHEDGKITKLMVLKPESQQVELGQLVFPGDVIARSAGDNYQNGKHVRMSVTEVIKNGSAGLKNRVIPVKFAVNGEAELLESHAAFEVVFPQEVVTREMTKKELKSFQKD